MLILVEIFFFVCWNSCAA